MFESFGNEHDNKKTYLTANYKFFFTKVNNER